MLKLPMCPRALIKRNLTVFADWFIFGADKNQPLGLAATLLATLQPGQEVDKSVMNASRFLWICQNNTEGDAKYMAKKLGTLVSEIPRIKLGYLVKISHFYNR